MKRKILSVLMCLCLVCTMLPAGVSAANTCVDKNRDYWCDDCGMLIPHTCVDANKDTWCDKCSCWIPHDCADRDGDHCCDQCGKVMDISVKITATGNVAADPLTTFYFYEGNYPSVFANVSGSPASHTFRCAANSRFQLVIMKAGHPSRTFSYNTYLSDIVIDTALYPYGDASQDGKINVGDVARIYSHVRASDLITEQYPYQCADVNGDQALTVGDVAKVYAHIRGTKPLF